MNRQQQRMRDVKLVFKKFLPRLDEEAKKRLQKIDKTDLRRAKYLFFNALKGMLNDPKASKKEIEEVLEYSLYYVTHEMEVKWGKEKSEMYVEKERIRLSKIDPNDIEAARKIFFSYCGSRQGIQRDGEDKEYDLYNISKDMETKWMREMFKEYRKKIDPESETISRYFYPLTAVVSNSVGYEGGEMVKDLYGKLNKIFEEYLPIMNSPLELLYSLISFSVILPNVGSKITGTLLLDGAIIIQDGLEKAKRLLDREDATGSTFTSSKLSSEDTPREKIERIKAEVLKAMIKKGLKISAFWEE